MVPLPPASLSSAPDVSLLRGFCIYLGDPAALGRHGGVTWPILAGVPG